MSHESRLHCSVFSFLASLITRNIFYDSSNRQNLEEEVVIHRRKIDTMEESGEWIIKTSNNNPEVISDIRSNISKAKSTIDEVTVRLNDRRRRLETALSENQKLQITFDDFSSRVGKVDKTLARAKPVSAMYIEIKEQRISHEVTHFSH